MLLYGERRPPPRGIGWAASCWAPSMAAKAARYGILPSLSANTPGWGPPPRSSWARRHKINSMQLAPILPGAYPSADAACLRWAPRSGRFV